MDKSLNPFHKRIKDAYLFPSFLGEVVTIFCTILEKLPILRMQRVFPLRTSQARQNMELTICYDVIFV